MRPRMLAGALAIWLVAGLSFVLAGAILINVGVTRLGAALGVAAVVGVINALVWPIAIRIVLPLTVLTLGGAVLVLNGGVILLAAAIVPGVAVDGLWAAVATALILTSAVMLATAVLSIDTDTRLGHHRRLRARNAEALAEMGSEPGILFLEIDGLAYPELLPALLAHPGIGFVLVRTEDDGAVVLGAAGSRWLADGRVEGEDPPAPFGRNASHGGMGGPQSYPFVLAPAGLEPHGEVVGAEGVHRVFRRWLTALGHTGYAAP